MRKLFALLMAVLMLGSLAVGALAAEVEESVPETTAPEQTDQPTTSLTLEYNINSGTAPRESFRFGTELTAFVDAYGKKPTTLDSVTEPGITIDPVTFDKTTGPKTRTEEVHVDVDTDDCPLGIYTYKVNQVDGHTAGVSYDTSNIYMVVTIYRKAGNTNDRDYQVSFHQGSATGSKITKLTNTYGAGTLSVTKTISGNMATMSETFKFSVTFTTDGTDKFSNAGTDHLLNNGTDFKITVTPDKNNSATSVTYTFELGHEKTLTFSNIPAGTEYTVEEIDSQGYTMTASDNTEGTVTGGGKYEVEVNNELKSIVDMGVALDSVPYVLVLTVAVIGLGAMMVRKRKES